MHVRPSSAVSLRVRTLLALLAGCAAPALAQDPAPAPVAAPAPAPELAVPATPAAEPAGEIVVTGSRIARSGYNTPTPVTVIGSQDIQAAASANIADFVNQIPSISGSVTPSNSQRSLANGTAGVNSINLRNLGPSRTLVLIDGRRSVGSTAAGTVDINTIPQGLVKSVEIVTGGASSVYGSDAVAGVVNFILDKDFTGIKGDFDYGLTTYGDDQTKHGSLTAGTSFAGGRGHLLVSGQFIDRDGVYGAPRPWAGNGEHLTLNPAYVAGNGQPEYLPSTRSGLNTTTAGGIITSGPLKGTYFGPGGSINHYNYGENRLVNSPWTIGGDWQVSQQYQEESLQPAERQYGVFGRASYDLFDTLQLFTEISYNRSHDLNAGGYQTDKANIAIAGDNAFIPASLRAQLNGQGFTLGSFNQDIPTRFSDNTRDVQRYLFGANGGFRLLGTDWKWDGYYQHEVSEAYESVYSAQRIKLGYAQDAVVNPANGQIVCRVTLQGSTDPLAAGCVPFNRLGVYGNAQQAALDYFMGTPAREETFKEDVAALNFHGNISNPITKPIGLAFGVEHRRESIGGYADPYSQANWISGNFLASHGHDTVTEGYVETLVPLPLHLDFDGAARFTSYSLSGQVTTWKAGFTWQPVPDLRLRATRSRDIRAPNLTELFQAGSRNTNSLADPWNGRNTVRYTQSVTGNLDLEPEKADTWGLGAIYRPHFLPGFGLSVDYYDIKIKGSIGTVSSQQTVDRCFAGNIDLCNRLQAVVGGATVPFGSAGFTQAGGPGPNVTEYLVQIVPFNFLQDRSRGLDFEATYRFRLDALAKRLPGTVSLRGLATRYLELSENDGVDEPTDVVGENSGSGPPKWLYRATLGYDVGRFSMELIGRGLSAGVYSNQYVECGTGGGCPATDPVHHTISDNHLPGAFYLDTYFAYTVPVRGVEAQLFLRVANLFDRDPAKVGKGPSDNSNVDPGINPTLYDYLGRTFRFGVRFDLGR